MAKIPTGECKTTYRKTTVLYLPHYNCAATDAQPCIEHIYCKDLGGGRVAAFGSYSVFLLFTYKDFSAKTACFNRTIRQPFCLSFQNGPLDADTIEVLFEPKVTVLSAGARALEWTVDVTADAKAVFYRETPPTPPKQDLPAVVHDEPAAPSSSDKEDQSSSSTAPEPETKKDDVGTVSYTRFWRIRSDMPIQAEKLLEMEDTHRHIFMEENSDTEPHQQ